MENDEKVPAAIPVEIEGETEAERLQRYARFIVEGTKAEYEKIRTRYITQYPQTASTLRPWEELSDEVHAMLLILLNQTENPSV